jgi:hypothetical protein
MIAALAFGTVWLFVGVVLLVAIVLHASDRRRDERFIFELRRRSRVLAKHYHLRGR